MTGTTQIESDSAALAAWQAHCKRHDIPFEEGNIAMSTLVGWLLNDATTGRPLCIIGTDGTVTPTAPIADFATPIGQ